MVFRAIGKGKAAAEKLFRIMNLGIPVSNISWKNHNSSISNIAKEIANDNMTVTDSGKDIL